LRQRTQMGYSHPQAQVLAYHPPTRPPPRLPVAATATATAARARVRAQAEAGHKSRRREPITHRPPLRSRSRSPSRAPSSFLLAGSHYTTAGSSPPKENALGGGPRRLPRGRGTKMDGLPAWLLLKGRSLHAPCSVEELLLSLIVFMMVAMTMKRTIVTIMVASQKRRHFPRILLIMPLRRTHQSRANGRANLACSQEGLPPPALIPRVVLACTLPLPPPRPRHHIVRLGIDDVIPSGVAQGAAMIPTAAVGVAPSGVRYLSPPVKRRSSHLYLRLLRL
jgi:hypothetical protein